MTEMGEHGYSSSLVAASDAYGKAIAAGFSPRAAAAAAAAAEKAVEANSTSAAAAIAAEVCSNACSDALAHAPAPALPLFLRSPHRDPYT